MHNHIAMSWIGLHRRNDLFCLFLRGDREVHHSLRLPYRDLLST